MANIGSVFLGDFQRHRVLAGGSSASSTPPSSPPPHMALSGTSATSFVALQQKPSGGFSFERPGDEGDANLTQHPPPPPIDPELALELRVRWLEAILVGVNAKPSAFQRPQTQGDGKAKGGKTLAAGGAEDTSASAKFETLSRLAQDLQSRFDAVVGANDALRKFMDHYDQNAHFLTPAFALSGILPDPPAYTDLSPEEGEAFLAEMEQDIRAADHDMREIEALDRKGVIGAGKLVDYEELRPRLSVLLKEHEEDLRLAAELEQRIATLMERHSVHVDALSELFVAWDDTITEAEDKTLKLEREQEDRRRLGLEA